MLSAKTILEKAEAYLAIGDNRNIKNDFLEKYSQCEVLCRPIIKDYLMDIGEYTSDEDFGMDLKTIKSALSEAGISFSDSKLLTRIWSKNDKKGTSSYRFLRNKISHELMERALHEVIDREDEINYDMDIFIETLRDFE